MCSACAITCPRVEDRRRAVAPLLDIRGVGRADEGDAHLLRHREERGADDLEGDAVHVRWRPPGVFGEFPAKIDGLTWWTGHCCRYTLRRWPILISRLYLATPLQVSNDTEEPRVLLGIGERALARVVHEIRSTHRSAPYLSFPFFHAADSTPGPPHDARRRVEAGGSTTFRIRRPCGSPPTRRRGARGLRDSRSG